LIYTCSNEKTRYYEDNFLLLISNLIILPEGTTSVRGSTNHGMKKGIMLINIKIRAHIPFNLKLFLQMNLLLRMPHSKEVLSAPPPGFYKSSKLLASSSSNMSWKSKKG